MDASDLPARDAIGPWQLRPKPSVHVSAGIWIAIPRTASGNVPSIPRRGHSPLGRDDRVSKSTFAPRPAPHAPPPWPPSTLLVSLSRASSTPTIAPSLPSDITRSSPTSSRYGCELERRGGGILTRSVGAQAKQRLLCSGRRRAPQDRWTCMSSPCAQRNFC